ncbi:MAG: hypothetical protein MK130_10195 [Puniceicoccaceae bacterium]|nr:hypothetical protein [Puniceicoccaceae bacterium]
MQQAFAKFIAHQLLSRTVADFFSGIRAYILLNVDLTEIDASDPNAVKISYSLPGNITFDSAVLEIGEEETLEKSNVNRTLEFTFNQDILVEPEDPLQYELDITLKLSLAGQTFEVHRQVCKIDPGLSGPRNELITAYFLVENVGLRLYSHELLNELYRSITYPGATVSGKTIYTRKTTSSLFLNGDPINWGERHKYANEGTSTPWVYMVPPSGDFIGLPGHAYREIEDVHWVDPDSLKGVVDTDFLGWRQATGNITPATPILNSEIRLSIEEQ